MESTAPRLDTAYRILANSRRRILLGIIARDGRRLTLNDLTKEIAVRERDAPITERSKEELTRIYLSLHHVHVPKLVDAGVVDYDRDRETVAPTSRLAPLLAYLGSVEPGFVDGTQSGDHTVP